MVKEQIASLIKQALKELGVAGVEPLIETPTEPSHGDYATNVALTAFAKSKIKNQKSKLQVKIQKYKTPLELAQEIVQTLNSQLSTLNFLGRAEAVPPGFINFWLSKDYLITQLQQVLKDGERFGRTANSEFSGKKIMVEFAHPNTHKLFHIGHLRNITLGEAICRLLESVGVKVIRANYQGDVGLHIAKAMIGIQKLMREKNVDIDQVKKWSSKKKAHFLGEGYVAGNVLYENGEMKNEIDEMNTFLYTGKSSFTQKEQKKIQNLYEETRQWSLDYFDEVYKRVGTRFDRLYFESEVAEPGKQLVVKYIDGVFKKDQGAIIFPGKEYGFHNRVFINSLGLSTYEAKDVGLATLQFEEFSPERVIHVVGPEQKGYFEVIFKALEMIDSQFAGKEYHLSYGLVRLKEGKMSSRSGEVVEGEWLLDEAKTRIKDQFKEILEETAEKVAVGAVKYSMLKFSPNSDIAFSFEESISLEGNSGPYLQYTYARTQSVLRKAQAANYKQLTTNKRLEVSSQKLEVEELILLRLLHRFPEIVTEAAEGFAPNLLCNYLFELAQAFNLFYQKHKILPDVMRSFASAQDDSTSRFRLALTASVGQILKNGLYLLGIEAPQRM